MSLYYKTLDVLTVLTGIAIVIATFYYYPKFALVALRILLFVLGSMD